MAPTTTAIPVAGHVRFEQAVVTGLPPFGKLDVEHVAIASQPATLVGGEYQWPTATPLNRILPSYLLVAIGALFAALLLVGSLIAIIHLLSAKPAGEAAGSM